MPIHSLATGLELHEAFHFVQEIDPGPVGYGKYWLQLSTGLKRRNAANDGWISFALGPEGPAGADGADGADGAPGAPGEDGEDGAPGADGTSGIVAPAFAALTDGATITWVCDVTKVSQNAKVTLGGNRTLDITGEADGMTGVLIVTQDGTGSRTLTLPAASKVIGAGAGAITLTTTAGAIDVLSWIYNGTNYLWTKGLNFT